MSRVCTSCPSTGPFYRDKRTADGCTAQCRACIKARNVAAYEANAEDRKRRHKAWAAAHPERMNAMRAAWTEKNADKVTAKNAAYRALHLDESRERNRQWHRDNPGRSTAAARRYQLAKEQRTPAWADHEAITAIYVEAAALGKHVDHALPLRGRTVSGLHVHQNLQLLSPVDNMRKGNRV